MNRANPLTPDERRRALIEATRPLLLEHGPDVTTRQIAQAACVAEGTIFRAYGTKKALVEAVVQDCLSPQSLIAALDAIPAGLSLEDTVAELIAALQTRTRQVRALMMALNLHHPHDKRNQPHQTKFHAATLTAVSRVLARFDGRLQVPTPTACWAITAMAFASSLPFLDDPGTADPRAVARLILHGIAAPTDSTAVPAAQEASC